MADTTDRSVDEDTWYRAVQARDARFDGRMFTAVLTTTNGGLPVELVRAVV